METDIIYIYGNEKEQNGCFLERSTHKICLYCGKCANDYSQTHCKRCLSRNNWGSVSQFFDLTRNLILIHKPGNWFHYTFWIGYNKTMDFLSKCF